MTAHHASRRLVAALGLALLGAAILTGTVAAHAELMETTPASDATVEGTPPEVVAVFSEGLRANGSGISLRNAADERVATGDVDPGDATRLVIEAVPDLAPGVYEGRWTAASADGHLERGTWTFTVTPAPTPTPDPTVAPTASASPSPSAAPSPTPASPIAPSPTPVDVPGDQASGTDVLLPILAGLAIVLIGAVALLGRRRTGPTA